MGKKSSQNGTLSLRPSQDAQIIALALQDVPTEAIAMTVDQSIDRVDRTIADFLPVFKALPRIGDFNRMKANILSAMQLTALESAMSESKLSKASFLATITGAEKLNRMERLELGRSTDNIAHAFGNLPIQDE